ncbi:hypothetical protein CEUSTIGMA_g1616.t1 [Chlamydomonas eustigma]|uniref:Uncharacterized protein n=1 Tax=Chlamydomonas eustigma TaxID=1157962 RepID=A0A250WTL0_9CHLO|nr:hypothetical protein CEUSTIGMA_g1616.t1 [Chlamydomonas eustigma]|eukprot:GAX74167.1 hypothetical protein CEUSTIGMA_g1616.t1 [Chlamydomonas eustigma]
MDSNQPYKTWPFDRIEQGMRRSQGASGSARVDQIASLASTSQGVPNLPPPPAQQTRDDPSPLSPSASTFHPSSSQGVSAVASALTGITKRGSSKKSEPSLVGDLSSSTSAAHSVKSGNSSHYRTPITTNTTPPIPTVNGRWIMLDEDVHDVPVHDSTCQYAYDTGPSHSQIRIDDEQERVPSLQEELVEVHAHATFPSSTMHPRGNPRPPLPTHVANSYQQRPPGTTGASRPASTSRPTGAPGVGSSPLSPMAPLLLFSIKGTTPGTWGFPQVMGSTVLDCLVVRQHAS